MVANNQRTTSSPRTAGDRARQPDLVLAAEVVLSVNRVQHRFCAGIQNCFSYLQ